MALPSPRAAPVTSAFLPSNRKSGTREVQLLNAWSDQGRVVARYVAVRTSPERGRPSNRSTREVRRQNKPSFTGTGRADGGAASLVEELVSCVPDGPEPLHPGCLPKPDVAPISGW